MEELFSTQFNLNCYNTLSLLLFFKMLGFLVFAGVVPAVYALPAPQMSYGENTGQVAAITPSISVATATSGSLYGSPTLAGEIAQPAPVSGGDSAIVSDYPLVNGQEADADLGLYLDFNSVKDPQPMRGDGGQTQAGPSKSNLSMY
jgi:hypothetical protein